jgi:hypothetical protein
MLENRANCLTKLVTTEWCQNYRVSVSRVRPWLTDCGYRPSSPSLNVLKFGQKCVHRMRLSRRARLDESHQSFKKANFPVAVQFPPVLWSLPAKAAGVLGLGATKAARWVSFVCPGAGMIANSLSPVGYRAPCRCKRCKPVTLHPSGIPNPVSTPKVPTGFEYHGLRFPHFLRRSNLLSLNSSGTMRRP